MAKRTLPVKPRVLRVCDRVYIYNILGLVGPVVGLCFIFARERRERVSQSEREVFIELLVGVLTQTALCAVCVLLCDCVSVCGRVLRL